MKKLLLLIIIILSACEAENSPCGYYEVSNELRKLSIGSRGGCYYFTPSGKKSYVDRSNCNCSNPDPITPPNNLNTSITVDKGIYIVNYNEVRQQPNWIEYIVSNRRKNVDRGSLDFYTENGITTSNDADYVNNKWDKGHLAPAATFSDNYDNLYKTFSFLNCALQVDNLNRGEWAELEQQVRDWSASSGNINVRVELVFSDGYNVLPTDAHVPTGFWKNLTFSDGTKKCFYFPNQSTTANWTAYEQSCN